MKRLITGRTPSEERIYVQSLDDISLDQYLRALAAGLDSTLADKAARLPSPRCPDCCEPGDEESDRTYCPNCGAAHDA